LPEKKLQKERNYFLIKRNLDFRAHFKKLNKAQELRKIRTLKIIAG